MVKAILFDCFGVVLADGLELMIQDLHTRDPEKALEAVDLVTAVDQGVMDVADYNQRMPALFGLTRPQYIAKLTALEPKDQRILSLATRLRATYKTAMLSNVTHSGFWRRFTPGELAPCFDDIVLSEDIRHAKPEPEAYNIAAERLGVKTRDCLLIDDRREYCDGARAAGMGAVLYAGYARLLEDLQSSGVTLGP